MSCALAGQNLVLTVSLPVCPVASASPAAGVGVHIGVVGAVGVVGVVGVSSCGVGLCVGLPLLRTSSSPSWWWWQGGLLLVVVVVVVVVVLAVAGWQWVRVRGGGGVGV